MDVTHPQGRPAYWRHGVSGSVNMNDVTELIRNSDRLHHRSTAAQRAAMLAGAHLRALVRRSIHVCGK